MSTKRGNCGGIGTHSPSSSNSTASGVCRKQSTTTANMQSGGGFNFEPKGERAACESSVSISSLKNRLAPTIRNTLAAAVDTLLGEMVLVLTETQQELVTKEQENERLKVRLEVSEREMKTLQDCLCSAQKLIDQLQGPFGGPPNYGQQFYPTSPPGSINPGLDRSRMGHRIPNGPDARCYGVEPDYGGTMGDASMGYDSRDDYKNCHLSIQADGTVTNHMFDSMAVNSQGMSELHRPDGGVETRRLPEGPGLGSLAPSGHRLAVKEEQGQVPGSLCRRGGREAGSETEQTAQSVGELGCIHVVEEEGGGGGGGGAGRRGYPQTHPPPPGPHGEASTSSGARGHTGLRGAQKTTPTRGSPGTAVGGHGGSTPGRSSLGEPGEEGVGPSAGEALTGTDASNGDRPHLCLECGKTFRLISSLKKHVRIHTGEKPYPCGVCGRRFRESGALKTHLRIHTGEKPYACSECGTRFRHLDGLRKHRRTHTGEKPYVCAICGKRLSRLQHLKHHQRIHTGERPCVCPCCHCSFKDPASLRKHLRTSHPGDPAAAAHTQDGVLGSGFKEDPEGGAGGGGGGAGGGSSGGGGGGGGGGGSGAGREDDPLQGSMGPSPGAAMRFGMWGDEEEQDEEEQPVVDCV